MSSKQCLICKREFESVTNKKYCNNCLTHYCKYCGKKFLDKSQIKRIYCSQKCSQMDKQNPNPSKEKIPIICKYCGKTFFVHQYRKNDAKYCSKRCNAKDKIGINAKNWQGGITPINHSIRCSEKMKLWRTSVFERDNYTCKKCGKVGNKLNAHHIIPFSRDESLRFELSNGVTLCLKCHKKEHLRLSQKKNKQMDIFQIKKENKCQ